MIIVNPNLRITQYYNSKKYAITIPRETQAIIDVNEVVYEILREINDRKLDTYEKLSKVLGASVIKKLFAKKIILDSTEFIYNENVLDKLDVEFPLHAITIELTNACNLNCIHCYGRFGQPSIKRMYTLENVVALKGELDRLHTMEVRLSGGECFMNPDFQKIALFFLDNGFKVSIYTNGFDTDRIIEFAEATKDYYYFMGISLDGTEEYHNTIRGNEKAFVNVCNTLTRLKGYTNIDILIATAVMKQNFENVQNVKKLKVERFPEYEQQIFLATPVNNTDFSFDYTEIPFLKDMCPEMFDIYYAGKDNRLSPRKKHRCQGGVGHGVLTVEGIMKMCPIAEEDVFIIGDITKSSLFDVWVNPKETIKYFRGEYVKDMPQCKKCRHKLKCGINNCRIEALRLSGNYKNANPYTCMVVKGKY